MNSESKAMQCNTREALTIIRDADYGQHILAVYDDVATLREIYADVSLGKLSQNRELLLILPYLETSNEVRTYLEEKGVDVRHHQSEGTLAIIDSDRWFSDAETNTDEYLGQMFSNLKPAGKLGGTIIRDIGAFFLRDEVAKLIGSEAAVSAKANANTKLVCCIHKQDFARLMPAHKQILISSHQKSLSVTGLQNIMFEEALAQSVNEAMSIYGKQVAQVLTSYLEREYSLPPHLLADNPQALTGALNSVLDSGSRIVERRILRLLYEKIGLNMPSSSASDFQEKIVEARKKYEKYQR